MNLTPTTKECIPVEMERLFWHKKESNNLSLRNRKLQKTTPTHLFLHTQSAFSNDNSLELNFIKEAYPKHSGEAPKIF